MVISTFVGRVAGVDAAVAAAGGTSVGPCVLVPLAVVTCFTAASAAAPPLAVPSATFISTFTVKGDACW